MRVRTYVREKHPLGDASQNTRIGGTFFVGKIRIWERKMWSACDRYLFGFTLFCFLWFATLVVVSLKSAFYREFFTLCAYISPYTNRGARNEKHLIHRKFSKCDNVSATFRGRGEWETDSNRWRLIQISCTQLGELCKVGKILRL